MFFIVIRMTTVISVCANRKPALLCSVARFHSFVKQKTAYEICQSLVGSEMCIRDRDTRKYRTLNQEWVALLLRLL